MNKKKKWLVALVCSLLFAGAALLAACDSGDKFYAVTAEFNAEQGTVTLTPSEDPSGYAKGEEVTATVTPNAEYTVGAVTVNGQAVTLTAENTYTFEVVGNTTVTATFTAIQGGDDGKTAFTGDFAGTWTQINGGSMTFTVTEGASAITITGGTQTITGTLAKNESDGFAFTTEDIPGAAEINVYALGTNFLYWTIGTGEDDITYTSYVFSKATWTPIAITESDIQNTTWTAGNKTDTLTISAEGEIAMTVDGTPVEFDIFYHDIAEGAYYALAGAEKLFTMIRFEGTTCSVTGDAGEFAFNAPDPFENAIFTREYAGTWKQINTASDVQIVIKPNTFTYNGTEYTVTARGEGGYTYKSGAFNTAFYLLGDNVLCVEFTSSNFGFFTIGGEKIDVAFPAGYTGEYTATGGQTLTIASNEEDDVPMNRAKFKASAGATARALQIVYVEQDEGGFSGPTPKFAYALDYNYGYSTYKITFSGNSIVMTALGGYPTYTFTKQGEEEEITAVESEEFAGEWQHYWRQANYKHAYIRITEDGGKYYFYYNEKSGDNDKELSYAAHKDGDGYKVTIDEVEYTLKMTSDKNFIYWTYEKDGSQITFFGKASDAEEYIYPKKSYSSVFPAYVDSKYTDGAYGRTKKLLFACAGQKDVFFDDRNYKPSSEDIEYIPYAQWGDDVITVVTFSSSNNSGTAIVGAKWYTFSFTGTSADDFSLTFTTYDGEHSYTFTKKIEAEQQDPALTFGDSYQGTWVDSDGFTIRIKKTELTVQGTGDDVAIPCTAKLEQGAYSFTYQGNKYTLTVVDDNIIYTTDQSGTRHYYCNSFGPNTLCYLKAGGSYINNTTWKTADGEHTLEVKSFHFTIDGVSAQIFVKSETNAPCYWNNMYWSSVTVSADGNTLTFTSHDGSQTLTFTKQA